MRIRRVLVTGSRDFSSAPAVALVLDLVLEAAPIIAGRGARLTVVHGGCPSGADEYAKAWARLRYPDGVREERHNADWRALGKAAGPIRNAAMVMAGADICVAFFEAGAGNMGTQDCVTRAHDAGIPVIRVAS